MADLLGYEKPQPVRGKYYESVSKINDGEKIAFFKIDRDAIQDINLNFINRKQYVEHIKRQEENNIHTLLYVVYAEENGFQLIIPRKLADEYFAHNKNVDGQWAITMTTDNALKDLISRGAIYIKLDEIFQNGVNSAQVEQVVRSLPLESILKKAINHKDSRVLLKEAKYYERDETVKLVAKILANGDCQLCELPAPFLDSQGNPFLESHHIIWLSKGGFDTLENSIALCPNCHSKMHILDKEEDVEKLKNRASKLYNELLKKYPFIEITK
ncbi:HNH endonuclease signature motif containing protein [Paenibacillus sp. FSL E2-0177]|uniref:HNH endonuclease n=1 Tax=Paenibacillus sp. FSL E2-0177 TaxID=2921360 RepID=UPI0030EE4366